MRLPCLAFPTTSGEKHPWLPLYCALVRMPLQKSCGTGSIPGWLLAISVSTVLSSYPTFHASPKLAMEAPPEDFAYTLLLSPDLGRQPHSCGRSLACDHPCERALSRISGGSVNILTPGALPRLNDRPVPGSG